jgi:hypothetical protein
MNWKSTSIIVISILCIGMYLGYLITYQSNENKKQYKQIIENERKIIDSLFSEIRIMKKERQDLEIELKSLTNNIILSETNLSSKINQLKIQNNVKIDVIKNSSNDELLGGLRSRFIKE